MLCEGGAGTSVVWDAKTLPSDEHVLDFLLNFSTSSSLTSVLTFILMCNMFSHILLKFQFSAYFLKLFFSFVDLVAHKIA